MGFLDSAISKIRDGLRPVYDQVIKPIGEPILNVFNQGAQKTGDILGGITDRLGRTGDKVLGLVDNTIDTVGKVESGLGSGIQGIGNFLQNPLYLIVGGVLVVVVIKSVLGAKNS
jgi:hypothetical protein